MADKEPRRRRKKRDASRKDEAVHQDLHSSAPQHASSQYKDSDQEVEDEPTTSLPDHQPSKTAQIVFMFFFFVLIALMSCVFIALRGSSSERGDNGLQVSDPFNLGYKQIDASDTETSIEVEALDEGGLENLAQNQKDNDVETFHDENYEDSVEDLSTSEPYVVSEEDLPGWKAVDVPSMHTSEDISTTAADDDNLETSNVEELELPTEDAPDILYTETPDDMFTTEKPDIITETSDEFIADSFISETSDPFVIETPDIATTDDTETMNKDAADLDIEGVTPVSAPEDVFEKSENEETLYKTKDASESEAGDTDYNGYPDAYTNYMKADITNEADYEIKEELDDIEEILEKSPERALQKFEDLLKVHPFSPRALFGKAKALDLLADSQHSNKILEEAIATYQKVMSAKDVPDALYMISGKRCAERMQFRGYVGKSIKLLIQMAEKFPRDVNLRNKIAVGYLMIGQNGKAKDVLTEVLKEDPNNGFAKVHLGFILKTVESRYEDAIHLMTDGIASHEDGVIDGRFFFHLGDALARVGKKLEAMKVYEEGVKEGLFLSVYQRSLYNVQGLTGKPWWNPESIKYSEHFKILEKNWGAIKTEALALTGKAEFIPESEGLQDYGEWQQFELYVRGRKVSKNCAAAPFTCSLIEQIPDASACKRGQVKFSVMQPGTHVWAHTGPTNCRLRAHLGLVVPEGVHIRVANETRTWQNGKIILFDDSFEHEVWHNGSSPRLVLIVDFWHPELTAQQKATLSPI